MKSLSRHPFFIALILLCMTLLAMAPPATKDWSRSVAYFPAYILSDRSHALVLELSNDSSVQDSVFKQVSVQDSLSQAVSGIPRTCTVADTIGRFRLLHSKKLENAMLQGINRHFYIYCTRGMVERDIRDVLFAVEECESSIIAFRFDKIDARAVGHPVFCSRQKLSLNYGSFPEIDQRLKALVHEGYRDDTPTIAFARMGHQYFTYHDDFRWGRSFKSGKCNFPARAVYELQKNGDLQVKWQSGLDLKGVPCD